MNANNNHGNSEPKYSCFTSDSINLMAEAAGLPKTSLEVSASISEEVTSRLKLVITRAAKFMRHSNRTRLTCADINKALRCSDCQPIFGYECNANQRLRYSYSTEAKVFKYENTEVDLAVNFGNHIKTKNLLSSEELDVAVPILEIKEVSD